MILAVARIAVFLSFLVTGFALPSLATADCLASPQLFASESATYRFTEPNLETTEVRIRVVSEERYWYLLNVVEGDEQYETDPDGGGASGPLVVGQRISWSDSGWYQVQTQVDYRSICEGGSSCRVPPGNYVVINHSTGQRWEDIVVSSGTGVIPSLDDIDNDGIPNFEDVDQTGGPDLNFDGIDDNFQAGLLNPYGDDDSDGIENFRDVDFTGGLDFDFDGIDDAYQNGVLGLNGDIDGDGVLNFQDVDFTNGEDRNFDGIDDAFQAGIEIPVNEFCRGTEGIDEFSSNDDWGDNCILQRGNVHANSSYVQGVQRILNCLGYPLDDNALFDQPTEQAVIEFQSDNPPLAVDGVVGVDTWRALRNTLEGQPFDTNYDAYSVGFYDPDGDGIDNSNCIGLVLFYQLVELPNPGGWEMAATPGSVARVPFSIAF